MSAVAVDIEPWELHSELILVSPEVCRRALELLPERDPYAFLSRPREPIALPTASAVDGERAVGLPIAVCGYALQRLVESARFGLLAVGGLAVLASLADVLH